MIYYITKKENSNCFTVQLPNSPSHVLCYATYKTPDPCIFWAAFNILVIYDELIPCAQKRFTFPIFVLILISIK